MEFGATVMPVRYVAFLRAINVGGHTVKTDDCRRLFEDMGGGERRDFIASGNVFFEASDTADRLERRLEAGLRRRRQVSGRHFLRTVPDVAAIAASSVFTEAEATDGALFGLIEGPATTLRRTMSFRLRLFACLSTTRRWARTIHRWCHVAQSLSRSDSLTSW